MVDFYTWTRDSALTFKCLVDQFVAGNSSLRTLIEDYILSQPKLQTLDNLSGNFQSGAGLGEPKFYTNETAFEEYWGRPQRDGPALRATAMIAYSNVLLKANATDSVNQTILPILKNDLDYVAQYWNSTGFDLWEEVNGSSFWTTAVQYRALVEGSNLLSTLGLSCPNCDSQAPQILCFLQDYWNGTAIVANINLNSDYGRSGRDANSILTSIHMFDPSAGCDDSTFQPCSSRALANHKVVVDSFRGSDIYSLNANISSGTAVSIGRYPEDIYQGGNPWYLCTLAAAEQLYDALYQWNKLGKGITIDSTNQAFFADFLPNINTGVYQPSSNEYANLTSMLKAYADGFTALVEKYTPPNGGLAEQWSKDNGTALSAADLTWSYASFLTAIAARAGNVTAPWASSSNNTVPATCSSTSAVGTYATPTATAFPVADASKTGGSAAGSSSGTATGSSASSTSTKKSAAGLGRDITLLGPGFGIAAAGLVVLL